MLTVMSTGCPILTVTGYLAKVFDDTWRV